MCDWGRKRKDVLNVLKCQPVRATSSYCLEYGQTYQTDKDEINILTGHLLLLSALDLVHLSQMLQICWNPMDFKKYNKYEIELTRDISEFFEFRCVT